MRFRISDKSIKKIAKIGLIIALVTISIPTLSLLFLKNRQVQTLLTSYFTNKISESLQTDISISKVNYSFFKRIQLYDFFIADQAGDTLMYSEIAKIWIGQFRPDKKNIQFKKIALENAQLSISVNEDKVSSIQFFVDSLKKEVRPEDKTTLTIEKMSFTDSRFRLSVNNFIRKGNEIDFAALDVRDVNIEMEDFLFRMDTTFMKIKKVSGKEVTGFDMSKVGFNLTINPKFMVFSEGWITTPLSNATIPVIEFRYNTPKNFKYLYDSVNVYISSKNSRLDFMDIAKFFPATEGMSGSIELTGAIFGKFGDLKGENILIDYLNHTRAEFDMHILGLPSPDSSLMDFEFLNFSTNYNEFRKLTASFEMNFLNDSSLLNRLSRINYQGDFKGYRTDFTTHGKLQTNLGAVNLSFDMRPNASATSIFKGEIETSNFQVGQLIGSKNKLGSIDFNMDIEGTNQNGIIEATVSGIIDTLCFYEYDYSNIRLSGLFKDRTFNGSLNINDPNIEMQFDGNLDFGNTNPAFDFTLDVPKFRPYFLHFRNDDPEYFASFYMETEVNGIIPDQLNGSIHVKNGLLKRTGGEMQLEDLLLKTGNRSDNSFLSINSELLDGEISGNYTLAQLPAFFAGLLNRHFDILQGFQETVNNNIAFNYSLYLKDINPFLDFFYPKLNSAKDVIVKGSFQPGEDNYLFSLKGNFPYLRYSNVRFSNIDLSVISDTSILQATIFGDNIITRGGFEIENPKFTAAFYNNNNSFSFLWDNDSTIRYSGDIYTKGVLSYPDEGRPNYTMTLQPSYFYYDNRFFNIPQSYFVLNSEGVEIDSFMIEGDTQHIHATGRYHSTSGDSITLSLENLNLNRVNDIKDDLLLEIEGELSGDMVLKRKEDKPVFTSNLTATNLTVNEEEFGTISLLANWIRENQQIELEVFSAESRGTQILAGGFYQPVKEYLDFSVALEDLSLKTISSYLAGTINDPDGAVDLNLTVQGFIAEPNINGDIAFHNASATVVPTKSKYHTSDKLTIQENRLLLDNFTISDNNGGRMVLNGNIATTNFSNPWLDVNLEATNFNFLSTTRYDNEQFYGSVFASGTANISGPPNRLKIVASAISEKNTNLKLPLYNALEIQKTDFITFRKKTEFQSSELPTSAQQNNRIALDMDLEITSDASVQLIFDPKVGDIIEASGNGALKLEIDDNGDFSMFGDIVIAEGEYLFTLQNVINKKFLVKPGGSISWNGSPTSATVNLDAVYETKASTYSLSPEPTEAMKKRIPVQCLLTLQGDLTNPTILPTIFLPTAEPETRSLVETSTGTDEELMRQFISLLVINNFSNTGTGSVTQIDPGYSNVAGVTASELLSNQLSNWLSQISNDFDIGVNYRPGDAISSDEVELALSTQLLNDRIIFRGNLDVVADEVATTSGEASNIVGDFDIEFKVTNKISLKAFNRVNDDRIVRPSLYTQGVGLLYRSEFNTLSDIFRRSEKKESEKDREAEDIENAAIKNEDTEIFPESY